MRKLILSGEEQTVVDHLRYLGRNVTNIGSTVLELSLHTPKVRAACAGLEHFGIDLLFY